MHRYLAILIIMLLAPFSMAQKPKKIEVQNADVIDYNEDIAKDVQRLIGNVVFKHENAFLYCDSAYFNSKKNDLIAFGHVHLIHNDSVHLYGDKLSYDGNTKIARVRQRVKLLQGVSVLTTDSLDFYRKKNIGHYFSWGKIVDKEHAITSFSGYYYTDNDDFFAVDTVHVAHEDYTIDTDSLRFNTQSEISYFFGKTEIISDSTHIFALKGQYDSNTKRSFLSKEARIISKQQILEGDSLYYDQNAGLAEGFSRVNVNDTLKKMMISGDYLRYNEKEGTALATQRALATKYDKGDSLFIHADTILLFRKIDTLWHKANRPVSELGQDSIPEENRIEGLEKGAADSLYYAYSDTVRIIKAFHHVQSFSTDVQSRCDSLSYHQKDSVLRMYGQPTIWSEDKQISARFIEAKLKGKRLDQVNLDQKAMIVMQDDSLRFNQIAGQYMEALFDTTGALFRLDVFNEAKSVFFAREEDDEKENKSVRDSLEEEKPKGKLIGVNLSESVNMKIWFVDNEPHKIRLYKSNTSVTNPPDYTPIEETRLEGFEWKNNLRPQSKADIFIWNR